MANKRRKRTSGNQSENETQNGNNKQHQQHSTHQLSERTKKQQKHTMLNRRKKNLKEKLCCMFNGFRLIRRYIKEI